MALVAGADAVLDNVTRHFLDAKSGEVALLAVEVFATGAKIADVAGNVDDLFHSVNREFHDFFRERTEGRLDHQDDFGF